MQSATGSAALLDAAHTQAFTLVSALSAGIAIVIAILAVTSLRRVRAGPAPHGTAWT